MSAGGMHTEVTRFVPTEDIAAYIAVGLDGGICGAGAVALGFTMEAAEEGVVAPLVRASLVTATSGAAVDGTVRTLKSNAAGKLIPTTAATDQVVGILEPAEGNVATAADQLIMVYPVLVPTAAEGA